MTNVRRATVALFEAADRQTRNIRYYFDGGPISADQLADYRTRAMAQINSGHVTQDVDLDRNLLD